MSIFNITPVGAYVDAMRAANEADRRATACHPLNAVLTAKRSRRLSVVTTARRAFARTVKTAGSLRAVATLRSRPI